MNGITVEQVVEKIKRIIEAHQNITYRKFSKSENKFTIKINKNRLRSLKELFAPFMPYIETPKLVENSVEDFLKDEITFDIKIKS